MADDKSKTTGADRAKVNTMESYEVDYLVQKHGVTKKAVVDAVKSVGVSRSKVEAALKKGKAAKAAAKKAPAKKAPAKKAAAKKTGGAS